MKHGGDFNFVYNHNQVAPHALPQWGFTEAAIWGGCWMENQHLRLHTPETMGDTDFTQELFSLTTAFSFWQQRQQLDRHSTTSCARVNYKQRPSATDNARS